jgi:TPR repeat protein
MNFYRNKFMLIIFFIIILSSKAFAYDLCENIVNAAWRGDYENVKSLIERGANPNCEFANKSVLFAASRYGRQFHWDENIEVVKLLVKYGADVNHKSFQNSEVLTPAYIAALFHHTKTALFLVDNGASLKDVEQGYLDRLKSEKASAASIELLGNLFNAAFNVPKDNDVANGYKSFKNGYMEEMENLVKEEVALADNCYDNKNYERAMYWFKAAAKWENTYAKYSLAHMYYYGLGGEKQWGKALKLLQNTTYVKGRQIQPRSA